MQCEAHRLGQAGRGVIVLEKPDVAAGGTTSRTPRQQGFAYRPAGTLVCSPHRRETHPTSAIRGVGDRTSCHRQVRVRPEDQLAIDDPKDPTGSPLNGRGHARPACVPRDGTPG